MKTVIAHLVLMSGKHLRLIIGNKEECEVWNELNNSAIRIAAALRISEAVEKGEVIVGRIPPSSPCYVNAKLVTHFWIQIAMGDDVE